MTHSQPLSRHGFLATTATAAATTTSPLAAEAAPPHQAIGVKVGVVTDSTAIIWIRLTAPLMTAQPARYSD